MEEMVDQMKTFGASLRNLFKAFDFLDQELFIAKLNTYGFSFPVGSFMFKVNNRNTRIRCEIYSKLTIKTPQRRHWCRSGVFIVNFEHISHLNLVLLL